MLKIGILTLKRKSFPKLWIATKMIWKLMLRRCFILRRFQWVKISLELLHMKEIFSSSHFWNNMKKFKEAELLFLTNLDWEIWSLMFLTKISKNPSKKTKLKQFKFKKAKSYFLNVITMTYGSQLMSFLFMFIFYPYQTATKP